jgi:hypothetical protein
MAKTTTNPFTQNGKVAMAYWVNGDGTIRKTLQAAGADYAPTEGAQLKALTVTNNSGQAFTCIFGLIDPSQPAISASAITATSTTAATSITITPGASSTTTALSVGMLVSGTNVAAGTIISAIGSSSALTLSKATTGAVSAVTFTPWIMLGHVTVPASSGGAAAGTTINVDLLGGIYVTGFPIDQSGLRNIIVPAGFKVAAYPMTVVPASSGGYQVIGQFEEF